jgi:hypothetical protein
LKSKSLVALGAGVLAAAAALPAIARYMDRVPLVAVEVAPPPAPAPTPQVDIDAFCNAGCKAKTDSMPKGLAKAFCWACCFETCRCKADASRCADAKEACSDHLEACPNMPKDAPTPPK